jgi:glutathione S-transferase
MADQDAPIVVLFGYESSTFTLKARLALKLKQIPYTFVEVPSMMPRPLLKDNFNLTYRKIPVLAIGKEIYCDTSIIIEALEHFFPESEGYQSLYPLAADGRNYRPLIRGFASYWTDRPLFRVACGLMPASIWASAFGRDREGLIGHKIDAEKLGKKIPENLSKLDLHLSILEPLFEGGNGGFIFSTEAPSLADISLYYELKWGEEVGSGNYTQHITAGETKDDKLEGAAPILNAQRYPGLFKWYKMIEMYFENLPSTEEKSESFDDVLKKMKASTTLGRKSLLLPTPRSTHAELDKKSGLEEGTFVSITPDDTGRDEYVLSYSVPRKLH